jgi:hypothetical protein
MKHGSFARTIKTFSARPSRNRLRAFVAIAFCLSSVGACHKVNSLDQSESFVIERQVLIPAARGKPEVLTRVPDGGFVVVGGAASAWAAATDANGRSLWKYSVPTDPGVRMQVQSTFHGVVPLASGGVLACGELFTKDNKQTAIVVILDSDGKLVEQRTIFPKDDQTVKTSSFQSCIAWGDGFALTGTWYDDSRRQAYYWLVKLNKDGVREWEKLGEDLPGFDGAVTSDQTLTLIGIPVHARAVTITRFNPKGEVVATRITVFREARAVRYVESTSAVKVIGIDSDTHNVLLSLTGDLKDTRPPKRLEWLSIREGCAYLLPDGSVALFGNKFVSGGVYRASIGWLDRHNADDKIETMGVPDRQDASYTVADAVPISPHQLVTLRDLETANPATSGAVLSWVTFK